MELSFTLLLIAAIFYAGAFTLHLFSFSSDRETDQTTALVLMRIGFLCATFYLAAEAIEHGFFLPVLDLAQAMAFFAWSLAFIYLVLLVKIQSDSFGLVLSPVLLILVGVALISQFTAPAGERPVSPLFHNPYFTIHIISAFFAYASFTISFAAGTLYLIQHRELKKKHAGKFYHKLTSLEELESLVYQPLFWGVPLLAATLAIGFMWSKSASGQYWVFDPKTIATGVTVMLYLTILYLRCVSSVRGRTVAVLSLIAFSVVVFSFVGTRFIEGSHNFLQ